MFGFNEKEMSVLRALDSPQKIQDFLNKLKINFEPRGDSCFSPRTVLARGECHCIEGAMLAGVALRIHGRKPLVVDMTASDDDFDHVIAVFQEDGKWGAISKTNHAVLRYREPIYNSIRELVMSYFHEYTKDDGKKTLRSFSNPVNLSKFDKIGWMTREGDVWEIPEHLAEVKHYKILNKKQESNLRRADKLEIKAGKLVQWKK